MSRYRYGGEYLPRTPREIEADLSDVYRGALNRGDKTVLTAFDALLEGEQAMAGGKLGYGAARYRYRELETTAVSPVTSRRLAYVRERVDAISTGLLGSGRNPHIGTAEALRRVTSSSAPARQS